jgi:hypothetical protein
VVTRNRQRERENEPHYHQGGEIHRYRLADLASWQDKLYWGVTIPVLELVPEPPAPKRIEKTITDPSPKLTRAQKGTKQGVMKLEIGWHRDVCKPYPEWQRAAEHCSEFLHQPLNYHYDSNWWIRHSELQYEGKSEPL